MSALTVAVGLVLATSSTVALVLLLVCSHPNYRAMYLSNALGISAAVVPLRAKSILKKCSQQNVPKLERVCKGRDCLTIDLLVCGTKTVWRADSPFLGAFHIEHL